MRYQFIEEYRSIYPITVLCTILEVSMSGYYAWRKRPMSEHQKEDALLTDQLQTAILPIEGSMGVHDCKWNCGPRASRSHANGWHA